jgi:hypothetical protein
MKVLIGVILIGVMCLLFWKNYGGGGIEGGSAVLAAGNPSAEAEPRSPASAGNKADSRTGTGAAFAGAGQAPSQNRPRDSRANAAHSLRQAFELLQQEPLSQLKQLDPKSAEFRQKIRELMTTPEFQQWQSLVKEAIAAGNCDWEIDYSQGFTTPLPHLGGLRMTSRILNALGALQAESGLAGQQVFSDNMKLITLACSDNQTLIGNLVRSALFKECENELSAAVNSIGKTDDAEALRNQLQVHLHDSSTDLQESFASEFALFPKMLDKLQSGSFDQQLIGAGSLASLVGDPVRTAIVKAEYTEATRTFQNALESANNWQERLLAAEQLQKAVDKLSPESRMLLEALPPIVNKMVDAEVHTQAALASLQIEQFRRQNGRFPENLVEAGVAIEDPIIAARLDYKDGKVEVKK